MAASGGAGMAEDASWGVMTLFAMFAGRVLRRGPVEVELVDLEAESFL